MKTSYKLHGNEKVYIIPIGDIHFGSNQFNDKYFDYCLDTLDAITQPKRIYLMGDLVESASKQVGNSAFKTNMSLDDQIDGIISYFKPYKRDIANGVIGNHCIRLSKEFDLDIMRVIGRALKIDTGNTFTDKFNINGEEFRIYSAHGKGSSAYAHTAQSKLIRDTGHVNANIIMHGHNHRCDHFSLPTFNQTDEGRDILRKHYVLTGGFIKYQGYAEQMQLAPLPESFVQLSVNKDFRVRSTRFNIDECRHDLMEL